MNATRLKITFASAMIIGTASTRALAQTAEPTYKGDPDVYKVIFEDANFRVIEATRRAGVHDKVHGHPVVSVVYAVTDCKTRLYAADGKTAESDVKAGTASAVPLIASHSAENIGTTDCKQIFVERK
jgi:oxalate decarboxylase/phosphoglucose isomerase-like protein (cupin superfamily)